jgi:NAD-dependent dihydropyrimidine dehydrogenase PreA subunit
MKKEAQPVINYNLCTKCGVCITGCPEYALFMTSKGPVLKEPALCTYCTECENICPTGAIRTPLTISWQTSINS